MHHRNIPALFLSFIFTLLVTPPHHLLAENAPFTEISAPEVKEMLDTEQVTTINVLSVLEFDLQHIPSSINIPINTLNTTTLLPENKEIPLIFYCMNIK